MQVNNLLVPDSKHGMFVTVIVIMFSPNDGIITYSNEGHNPPIIHRVDNTIQELRPTGMALGILEDITIGENTYIIHLGERLLAYTDGVTEAFSTDDEMFGVDRLQATIVNSHAQTASTLLLDVEHSLAAFLGSAQQSDDLTIAALIRK
jgi:sigma-B regulation protein RsbU (phosphoserine phosphatase)